MNQGADYMEKLNKDSGEYVHKSFDVTLDIYAPIIFIPEDLNDYIEKRCMILNMG